MARLTIPDEPTSVSFTVTTPTSAFPISFAVFEKGDLIVTVDEVELSTSDFTFAGTLLDGGGYQGGTVTLNDAVDDCTVLIRRVVNPLRGSNFAPSNSVPIGSVDMAFNRLTATQQDLLREIRRIQFYGLTTDLDGPAARAAIGLGDQALQDIALGAVELRPEDFRSPLDGSDWAPAWGRLEQRRQQLANTGTRRINIAPGKQRYKLRSGLTFSVGLNHSLPMNGAGYLLDGSRFEVDVEHWADPDEPVITVQGDEGQNSSAQFSLGNIAIVQPPGGPAKIALRLQNLNAPPGQSRVHDAYIEGFATAVDAPNTRLVVFDRVVIWAENLDDAKPLRFIADGVSQFAGDVTFNECQVVTGVPGQYTPNGSTFLQLEARNGGEARGFTFNRFIGYHADTPLRWIAETGGVIADVWFNPGTQFDKIVDNLWDIRALSNGAGSYGTINNINFNGVYWTSINVGDDVSLMYGARGDPSQINANSGNVSEVIVANCKFFNFPRNVYFTGVVGLHLIDNDFYGFGDPLLSIDAIVVLDDCHGIDVRGNVARAPSGVVTYAVIVSSNCSQIELGPWLGGISAVRDDGGITRSTLLGQPVLQTGLKAAVDDAAAAAAGVPLQGFYESAGVVRVRKA